MITIVNYGLGNLGSIKNMLRKAGYESQITSDPETISKAEKLILPGVGSFDKGMSNINNMGLRNVLEKKALEEKVPVLGICLGMQLMCAGSEEGILQGLGWIPADVLKFRFSEYAIKVPHMGWNSARVVKENLLAEDNGEDLRYYFVHSYYARVREPKFSFMKTSYGIEFDSGVFLDNLYGVQFHPEKSHRFGMAMLTSFAKI